MNVTDDETWVAYVNTRQNSSHCNVRHTISPSKPKKAHKTLSVRKVMAAVFWCVKGILLFWFYVTWYDHHFCSQLWHFEKTKKSFEYIYIMERQYCMLSHPIGRVRCWPAKGPITWKKLSARLVNIICAKSERYFYLI